MVRLVLAASLVPLGALGLASSAAAQATDASIAPTPVILRPADARRWGQAWVGEHALVRLRAGESAASALHDVAAEPVSEAWRIYRVHRVGGDGAALADELLGRPGVEDAMPDLHVERVASEFPIPPNDPRYGGQWYHDVIGIEAAWAIEDGTPETVVVIVDNGCDMMHPDLEAGFGGGRDVRDQDDDPSPLANNQGNEHGTACAGIIGARAHNGIGLAGVCPECTLHCVRLLGRSGDLTPISADVRAFEYARSVGASVVSNSWGFTQATPVPPMLGAVMESLYDEGRDGLGTLVVFAAGNDGREVGANELMSVRGVVAVSGINLFDEAVPFSNFGATIDIAAPTATVTTDLPGADGENETDYTALFGGTSSACPVVAGAAGLLFSADPEATAEEVAEALMQSARAAPFAVPDADGHDDIYGFGIVDPAAALAVLVPDRVPGDGGPGGAVDAGMGGGAGGGCGCRATGSAPPGAAWGVLFVVLAFIRRRAHTTSG